VLPYDLNDEDQLDLVPGAGTPAKTVGTVPLWKRIFWEGGRPVDAFLTVVSARWVCVWVGGWGCSGAGEGKGCGRLCKQCVGQPPTARSKSMVQYPVVLQPAR